MTKERKRYLVTTPRQRTWKRQLTLDEVQQLKQAGFQVEEIESVERQPNRAELRRQGLHLGKYRMPKRNHKPKRRTDGNTNTNS